MNVTIVIPARYESTRYPGKPLVSLKGASGTSKSLIQRSWEAAMSVPGVSRVVVATDDDRIESAAKSFGAEVIMTSSECRNGTERCAESLEQLDEDVEIIVNLQGDAPLTPSWFIEDLVGALVADPSADVATPVLRADGKTLSGFMQDRKAGRVGGTTAVFDVNGRALYFSKEVIPYTVSPPKDKNAMTLVFHHVGVYAYRPETLKKYVAWDVGFLEGLEGLEQLRFVERGKKVLCVEVDARNRQFWELNNPEDVPRLEKMMSEMGIE